MGKRMENRCLVASMLLFCVSAATANLCYVCASWIWCFATGLLTFMTGISSLVAVDISRHQPAESHTLRSLLIQYLAYRVLSNRGRLVHRMFLRSARNVKQTQERLLAQYLQTNKDTAYGKSRSFCSIRNREDYVSKEPLTVYSDYEAYIESIKEGRQNILTKDNVVFLSMSSGTTGTSKVLPVTSHMTGPTKFYVGSLMHYFVDQTVTLRQQRVFVLSYKSPVTTEPWCFLGKGPITSHMSRYMPYAASPQDVFQIANEQTALYCHALFSLQEEEIGSIEAIFSTLVYSFWSHVENNWPALCDNIERGTIPVTLDADRDILITLKQQLRPNQQRAVFLRNQFSKGFKGIARRVWPNLRYARMLTTGSFATHARILEDHFMQDVIQISQTHGASEGFMGFNMSCEPDDVAYTLMIEYSFFEFIPLSDIDQSNPPTLFAEQLQLGEMYEIVMTTPMGLYRYRTGDIIKIVGFCHQCPVYKFQYRTGQILNLFWEKTPESVVYDVVAGTLSKMPDLRLVDYTTTEDIHVTGMQGHTTLSKLKHYILFIELEIATDLSSATNRLSIAEKSMFDRTLRGESELYDNLRALDSIAEMAIYQVKAGTFLQLKSMMIEQSQSQQYKVPRVLRHTDMLQFLLSSVPGDSVSQC